MEKAVLGTVLEQGKIPPGLGDDSFSLEDYRLVFCACDTLNAKGEPINPLTVFHQMGEPKTLGSGGGLSFLVDVHKAALPDINIGHYVRILNDKELRRRTIRKAAAIALQARTDSFGAAEVIQSASAAFRAMVESGERCSDRINVLDEGELLRIEVSVEEMLFDGFPLPKRGATLAGGPIQNGKDAAGRAGGACGCQRPALIRELQDAPARPCTDRRAG